MLVLIVETQRELGTIWKRHLERSGCRVILACDQETAFGALRTMPIDVIVLDLVIADGHAFAVADFAAYRRPEAKIIFVTNTTFFSDGSIFRHTANAAAFLPSDTAPDDLCAVVEHHCPHEAA